jgi:hypothetical protein
MYVPTQKLEASVDFKLSPRVMFEHNELISILVVTVQGAEFWFNYSLVIVWSVDGNDGDSMSRSSYFERSSVAREGGLGEHNEKARLIPIKTVALGSEKEISAMRSESYHHTQCQPSPSATMQACI